MENRKIRYEFSARTYRFSSSEDMVGWTFVSLPEELSAEIRGNFKCLEEGWGRMKVTAAIGGSEWQTAIWFDTKQDTYLLPIKAAIRKAERVAVGDDVRVSVLI